MIESERQNASGEPASRAVPHWKGRRGIALLLFGLLLLVSVLGYFLRNWRLSTAPMSNEAFFALQGSSLDFGEVWVDPHFKWQVTLTNRTSRPISLTDVKTSCGCVAVKIPTDAIPPNATTTLDLDLNLATVTGNDGEDQVIPFSASIFPQSRGTPEIATGLELTGRVRRAFVSTPSKLQYERPVWLGDPLVPMTLSVRCLVPLESLTATCEDGLASVTAVPNSSASKETFSFHVAPRSTLGTGATKFTVLLSATTREGRILAPYPIEGQVHVRDHVRLLPPGLLFGPLHVGDTVSEVFSVSSIVGRTFVVTSVVPSTPSIRVELIDQGEANYQYRITQTVTAKTRREHVRIVVSDGAATEARELVLPVDAHTFPRTSAVLKD